MWVQRFVFWRGFRVLDSVLLGLGFRVWVFIRLSGFYKVCTGFLWVSAFGLYKGVYGLGPLLFACLNLGVSRRVDDVFGFQEALLKELVCVHMMRLFSLGFCFRLSTVRSYSWPSISWVGPSKRARG